MKRRKTKEAKQEILQIVSGETSISLVLRQLRNHVLILVLVLVFVLVLVGIFSCCFLQGAVSGLLSVFQLIFKFKFKLSLC